ncbi:MAG TPA: glycosyltransferase [Bdellovibrionota bacterium]|nr:glycosyltransferase [Bdellovibrionota bacterium]
MESVRKYNSTIPIVVFIYGSSIPDGSLKSLGKLAHLESCANVPQDMLTFLKWTSLQKLDADEVLFLDADTFASADVQRLFSLPIRADFLARKEVGTSFNHSLEYYANFLQRRQIDPEKFCAFASSMNIPVTPVFNTGVMLFQNKTHLKVAENLPFLFRMISRFEENREQYPCDNWHLRDEIAGSLLIGSIPGLTYAQLPKEKVPWYFEYLAGAVKDWGVVMHTLSHHYAVFLRELYYGERPQTSEKTANEIRKILFGALIKSSPTKKTTSHGRSDVSTTFRIVGSEEDREVLPMKATYRYIKKAFPKNQDITFVIPAKACRGLDLSFLQDEEANECVHYSKTLENSTILNLPNSLPIGSIVLMNSNVILTRPDLLSALKPGKISIVSIPHEQWIPGIQKAWGAKVITFPFSREWLDQTLRDLKINPSKFWMLDTEFMLISRDALRLIQENLELLHQLMERFRKEKGIYESKDKQLITKFSASVFLHKLKGIHLKALKMDAFPWYTDLKAGVVNPQKAPLGIRFKRAVLENLPEELYELFS